MSATVRQAIIVEGIIVGLAESNVMQDGAAEIDEALFQQARPLLGRARLVDGAIVEIPAEPTPALSIRVSAVQAKTALYDAGLYDDVEAAMQAFPYPLVRIWWASAQQWVEDHPYVYAVAQAKGLTDDEVHQLFVAASAVPT